MNEARNLIGLEPLSDEMANKHLIPAFLVGTNVNTIEDYVMGQPTDDVDGAGSTDPQGGEADLPAEGESSTSNNSAEGK